MMEPSNVGLPQEQTMNLGATVVETEAPPIGNMVEDVGMEEPPMESFDPSQDIADVTMARIYDTHNEGTKEEQLFNSANQYIDELFSLGNSMPELGSMTDAQNVLENMYQIESESPLEYNPKGEMSRELVDTLNGRLAGKKKIVAEMRQKMITPQLDIVSIPEGATEAQIREIQSKVGSPVDGIVGPNTDAAIRQFNKLQQEEALEQRTSIDPVTGLETIAVDAVEEQVGTGDTRKKLKLLESSNKQGELTPYKDGDFYSVGFGHFLTPQEKTSYEKLDTTERASQNQKWFDEDMIKHTDRVENNISNYASLSDGLQEQLLFAEYRGSLGGSPNTRKLIQAGEFKKASKAFLNNAEYRAAVKSGSSVAQRMEAVAEALANE